MKFLRRWIKFNRLTSEVGTAAIEMAILSLVMIPMAIGTIDLGRAFYHGIVVENAARAGTSYGALKAANATNSEKIIDFAVEEGKKINFTRSDVDVPEPWCECDNGSSIDCGESCTEGVPRKYLKVTVTKAFHTVLNYPGTPESVDLSREAIMRIR